MRINPDDKAWQPHDERFWIRREPRIDDPIIIDTSGTQRSGDHLRDPTASFIGYDTMHTGTSLGGTVTGSTGWRPPYGGGSSHSVSRPSAPTRRQPRRWLVRSSLLVAFLVVVLPFGGGVALNAADLETSVSVTRNLVGADGSASGQASLGEANEDLVKGLLAIMHNGKPFDGAVQERAAAAVTADASKGAVGTVTAGYGRRVLSLTMSDRRALEVYVNQVSFGHGIRGVCDASYFFFGMPPIKLSPEQATALAVVASAPGAFDRGKVSGIRRTSGKELTKNQREKLARAGSAALASRTGAEAWLTDEAGARTCSKSKREVSRLIASARAA